MQREIRKAVTDLIISIVLYVSTHLLKQSTSFSAYVNLLPSNLLFLSVIASVNVSSTFRHYVDLLRNRLICRKVNLLHVHQFTMAFTGDTKVN